MRAFLPHLVCLGLIGAALAFSAITAKSQAEWSAQAREGAALDRIAALHVLANRPDADPAILGAPLSQTLLTESDPLLVEYAGSIDPTHLKLFRPLEAQLSEEEPNIDATWLRRFFVYRRKVGGRAVGGRRKLRRAEFGWWLDAIAGRPLPTDQIHPFLSERAQDDASSRQLMVPPKASGR